MLLKQFALGWNGTQMMCECGEEIRYINEQKAMCVECTNIYKPNSINPVFQCRLEILIQR